MPNQKICPKGPTSRSTRRKNANEINAKRSEKNPRMIQKPIQTRSDNDPRMTWKWSEMVTKSKTKKCYWTHLQQPPIFEELRNFGRHCGGVCQMPRRKSLKLPVIIFFLITIFGGGVKMVHTVLGLDFWPKMTSTSLRAVEEFPKICYQKSDSKICNFVIKFFLKIKILSSGKEFRLWASLAIENFSYHRSTLQGPAAARNKFHKQFAFRAPWPTRKHFLLLIVLLLEALGFVVIFVR